MRSIEEYLFAYSVAEAVEALRSHKGEARIISGGTDLVPELKKQERQVNCLVDISRIEELKSITTEGDTFRIGAGVTHSQVAVSDLIKEKALLLAEAALSVGSPTVRNAGTIVGNVVNAQPAADTAVALFALEATVEIASPAGTRILRLDQMYQGPGKSSVNSNMEIVTAISFKGLGRSQGGAFTRLSQRKALTLPMLNAAAVVTLRDSHFEDVRIVVAPVALLPFRSRRAEAALAGSNVTSSSIERAALEASIEAQPRDSQLRGSARYRKEMVKVFVKRALETARERAEAR
jgi:CO/xanthine dehydrogenase FAD-binding subunit